MTTRVVSAELGNLARLCAAQVLMGQSLAPLQRSVPRERSWQSRSAPSPFIHGRKGGGEHPVKMARSSQALALLRRLLDYRATAGTTAPRGGLPRRGEDYIAKGADYRARGGGPLGGLAM
jgi:hypothetical protein